ncbi:MAG: hypothetical protein QM730_08015 [Anaerolineales bacterium]
MENSVALVFAAVFGRLVFLCHLSNFLIQSSTDFSSIDFGIAAIVLGVTLRSPGVFAFLFGFIVTLIGIAIYTWDKRRMWEGTIVICRLCTRYCPEAPFLFAQARS